MDSGCVYCAVISTLRCIILSNVITWPSSEGGSPAYVRLRRYRASSSFVSNHSAVACSEYPTVSHLAWSHTFLIPSLFSLLFIFFPSSSWLSTFFFLKPAGHEKKTTKRSERENFTNFLFFFPLRIVV